MKRYTLLAILLLAGCSHAPEAARTNVLARTPEVVKPAEKAEINVRANTLEDLTESGLLPPPGAARWDGLQRTGFGLAEEIKPEPITPAWERIPSLPEPNYPEEMDRFSALAKPKQFSAVVQRVLDGDTFDVKTASGIQRIRLHLADCPEIAHNAKETDQPHGQEAREWTSKRILGKRVTIEQHGESYGRIVGDVLIDNKSLARGLLRAGLAEVDTRFGHNANYLADEQYAKDKGERIWSGPHVDPWLWRKGARDSQPLKAFAASGPGTTRMDDKPFIVYPAQPFLPNSITATTVGKNIVTLANPGAITFPRINADNTVTARSASQLQSDLGLVIGTNVQAFDSDLTTWAGITPGTGVGTALQSTINSGGGFLTASGSWTASNGTAGLATALATGRAINGVTFDGTADITVTAAASTLSGTTLASGITASSLTSFGSSIALGTPASGNFSSGTFTWPTFNQNTTGSAATLTTSRTIGGGSFNGSANVSYDSLLGVTSANNRVYGFSGSGTPSLYVTASANTASALVQRDSSGNFSAGTITAALTGNASTATALATGRTIGITGDVTWTSPSFDGSGNVTASSTVTKINGTSLAGLATGLLKNTTITGVPSIATSGTDYAITNVCVLRKTDGTQATYSGPEAAQTAASSGQNIEVYPGSYTTTTQLGKDGVNWKIHAGATITNSTTEVWGDSNTAISYSVEGSGRFVTNGSNLAVIRTQHSGSSVVISGLSCEGQHNSSSPGMRLGGGYGRYAFSDYVRSAHYDAIWVDGGDNEVRTPWADGGDGSDSGIEISGGTSRLYCQRVTGTDPINIIGPCTTYIEATDVTPDGSSYAIIVDSGISTEDVTFNIRRINGKMSLGDIINSGSKIKFLGNTVVDTTGQSADSITILANNVATITNEGVMTVITKSDQTNSFITSTPFTITNNGSISYNKGLNNVTLDGGISTAAGVATRIGGTVLTGIGRQYLTATGTSGAIPYYSGIGTLSKSALLGTDKIMLGGGAGAAPYTTTTGANLVTAFASDVNTAGGLLAPASALTANALVIGGGSGTGPSTTTTASGFLTFAATPSSANLRALLTDESGTGVFLTANGAMSGGTVNNSVIGGTTAAAGSFTALTSTGQTTMNVGTGAFTIRNESAPGGAGQWDHTFTSSTGNINIASSWDVYSLYIDTNNDNSSDAFNIYFNTAVGGGSPTFQVQGSGNAILAGNLTVGGVNYAADAGSNDTYAITLSPVPAAYTSGMVVNFKANTANTGAATLNVNSLGAKTIKKVAGGITTDLADNDIRSGQFVTVIYDGTNFQMQSLMGNAPSGGGGVTALWSDYTSRSTSGTGSEANATARTIPANTFAANGDFVDITSRCRVSGAGGGTQKLRYKLGSAQLLVFAGDNFISFDDGEAIPVEVRLRLMRVASDTLLVSGYFVAAGANSQTSPITPGTSDTTVGSLDFTGTLTFTPTFDAAVGNTLVEYPATAVKTAGP